jgi:hypothetical protein
MTLMVLMKAYGTYRTYENMAIFCAHSSSYVLLVYYLWTYDKEGLIVLIWAYGTHISTVRNLYFFRC